MGCSGCFDATTAPAAKRISSTGSTQGPRPSKRGVTLLCLDFNTRLDFGRDGREGMRDCAGLNGKRQSGAAQYSPFPLGSPLRPIFADCAERELALAGSA